MEADVAVNKSKKRRHRDHTKRTKHRDHTTRTKRNDVVFDQLAHTNESPQHTNESPLIDPFDKKKRTRGTSVNLKLQQLPSGVKVPLKWDIYDCPIGEHANTLSTQCGIVVKFTENCPLQKRSFMDIDKEKRLRLVDLVMEHFDSERNDRRDRFVLNKLCKKYNDYRCDLRTRKFCKLKTFAERLANRPTNISREDWKWLVKFWTLDKKFQDTSIRNRANSSRLKLRHATGSKSYARHRAEWKDEKGKEPTRLELFEITHNIKDEASASVLDAFERAKSQMENDDQTVDDEMIYSSQFPQKKPGRVHGMGPIVKPSQLGLVKGGSSAWLRRQQEQQDTIDGLKGTVSELKNRVSEMEGMKVQFSQLMTFMNEMCKSNDNAFFSK